MQLDLLDWHAERCGSSAAERGEGTKARSDIVVILQPLVLLAADSCIQTNNC